jgi:predicted ATPase
MYISKFQVTHFKSYLDSGDIEFKPGFNVLTGQNSAGKTALLDALTLQYQCKPHRSEKTIPFEGAPLLDSSFINVTFEIDGPELIGLMRLIGEQTFPAPKAGSVIWKVQYDGSADSMNKLLSHITQERNLRIAVVLERTVHGERMLLDNTLFLGLYPPETDDQGGTTLSYQVRLDPSGDLLVKNGGPQTTGEDVRHSLANVLRQRIYKFRAERFSMGESPFGKNRLLATDGSNLPEVLGILQSNPYRFEELNKLVRQVLPQVQQVSVRPFENDASKVQIIVWPHSPSSQKEYLAVPLTECGSGVGQVLAILYVVLNSPFPITLLIDEPQSFLHPGAVRKLIEVLKDHPRHQYVLATHSPAVIAASDPATITISRSFGPETRLESIDPTNTKELRGYLSEVGARLGDVFGADKILWVEGQTEEVCFPLILKKVANRSLMGTAIVGVQQTGDLQGRDRKRVLELYQRLSGATSLLPPAIAFIFDSECLKEQQKRDLTKMDPDHVHFLPKRMYENYLLDEDAVASTLNDIEEFPHRPISPDRVAKLFADKREAKHGNDRLKYFCDGVTAVPLDWKSSIDAAKVLSEVFEDLSDHKFPYAKTTHSVAITQWLLDNKPEALNELATMLVKLLDRT